MFEVCLSRQHNCCVRMFTSVCRHCPHDVQLLVCVCVCVQVVSPWNHKAHLRVSSLVSRDQRWNLPSEAEWDLSCSLSEVRQSIAVEPVRCMYKQAWPGLAWVVDTTGVLGTQSLVQDFTQLYVYLLSLQVSKFNSSL